MFSVREVVRKLLESLATKMIITDEDEFAKQHFYKKLGTINATDGAYAEMEITKTQVNIKKDGQSYKFGLTKIDEILDCFLEMI